MPAVWGAAGQNQANAQISGKLSQPRNVQKSWDHFKGTDISELWFPCGSKDQGKRHFAQILVQLAWHFFFRFLRLGL